MIKKTAILLICSSTITVGMEKIELMKNGASVAKTMTQNQKIQFMRNGGYIFQQISEPVPEEIKPIEVLNSPIPQDQELEDKIENKPPEPVIESPIDQEIKQNIEQPVTEDDKLTEEELINHAIKLSLNETQPILKETIQAIQKINNVPGKNIIINYNVTIKQKLKNSSQNINIGNKNNNY